ncbi:hypothetical protein L596_025164 [Steinernema carpocapsae]|uniref:Transmembrane and coiled-coil domain-containing protein 4 n=1 Tax=Steinernema carpocapsae TaxID=34508 RepID=A0A4U5M728_STECR|nr:hypothetical protein L596_025164 [Steinernema carpocapsae]
MGPAPEEAPVEEMASRKSLARFLPFRRSQSNVASPTPNESMSPEHRSTVMAASQFNQRTRTETRFAFSELICAILRLDFYDLEDPHQVKFCEASMETILRKIDLGRKKEKKTIREHLKGEGTTEDICALISAIKEDPFVVENGTMSLLILLVLITIEKGEYDSRFRVMLRHIGALLGVSWDQFEEVEDGLTHSLLDEQYIESESPIDTEFESEARETRAKSEKMKKIKRIAFIGTAGTVGGLLIGLTGGLAAPLVATGAGVIIGTGAAAGIATTAGAAVLGSVFGVAGAGLVGYKMKKRVGAIEEFTVEALTQGHSLHSVLCVSGWISENTEDAFKHQWRHLWMSREQYSLRYESKYLVELGKALDYFMTVALSMAIQHTLMETALAGLLAAIAWPVALLSVSSVLDNPWSVCAARTTEVGEQLAEVLLSRAHGKRPITLIGFSLGARVIYHCLLAMSRRTDCRGIVGDVVLLGAPVSASPKQWKQLCSVVGGRVINGYCETDWLLRFVYRTMSVQFTIAGTGPVDVPGQRKVLNFNLSHIVKGHLDYAEKLTEILEAVGIRVTPRSAESTEDLKAYERRSEEEES